MWGYEDANQIAEHNTMKKYKNLFIDLDDTLYDTKGNSQIALDVMYDHFHLERYFQRREDFMEPYWLTNVCLWAEYAQGRITRDYLIVERFRRPLSFGKGIDPTPELCREISEYFLDQCAGMPGVVDGAHEALDYLKGQGYRIHICSNGFHEVQYRKLRASQMMDRIDSVVLSEDAGFNKPAKEFFLYALRTTGASLESTLMIGDNFITDIEGAKGAGLDVMFFNRCPADFTAPSAVNYEIHSLAEIKRIL